MKATKVPLSGGWSGTKKLTKLLGCFVLGTFKITPKPEPKKREYMALQLYKY